MRWFALARDIALLGTAASVLGAASLAIRLDVAWTPPPPPPEATACGVDEFDAGSDLAARAGLASIALSELAPRAADVVFVDARSAVAFAQGHIPGAISLPATEIDALVASESLPLPVDRDIVTYCDGSGGVDAQYVGQVIDAVLGCGRVVVLEGGFATWVDSGALVEGMLQSG